MPTLPGTLVLSHRHRFEARERQAGTQRMEGSHIFFLLLATEVREEENQLN